jgi:hypothetical protein
MECNTPFGENSQSGLTPSSKWQVAEKVPERSNWRIKVIKQKKPPFTESLSLARLLVADLVSLSENTTQQDKDRKGF